MTTPQQSHMTQMLNEQIAELARADYLPLTERITSVMRNVGLLLGTITEDSLRRYLRDAGADINRSDQFALARLTASVYHATGFLTVTNQFSGLSLVDDNLAKAHLVAFPQIAYEMQVRVEDAQVIRDNFTSYSRDNS